MNSTGVIVILGVWLLTLAGAGFTGWHERAVRVPAELTAQSKTDAQECDKAQQITKGANDALQKSRDKIAAKLSAYKLQHPSTCVRITSRPNVPIAGAGHAANDGTGLNSSWLLDFAATCEQYRSEVSTCASFLAQERTLTQPKN